MVRKVISFVLGVLLLYGVWVFVYSQFPEVRPIMDDTVDAVQMAYQWAVNRWGGVAVAGVILLVAIVWGFQGRR